MIYLVRGNDFDMAVALAKKVDDTTIPYELTNATRLRLALVGHGMHVFAEDVQVSPLSSNTLTGMVPGRGLLLGEYGLEITFRDNGKDKRFFVDNMFTVVNELVEDTDDEAEGEGGGIEVTIVVQPEDIDFSGAMGTAAGFGTPTIEVDANVGTPSAEITAEGPDTAKIFHFLFHNLKGEPGSDASVTAANIASALGYTPVSPAQLAAKTDVFWAVYGETTTTQIQTALSARKTVLCIFGPLIYQLVYNGFLNDESTIFANVYNNDGVIQLATLIVGSDDTWSSRAYSLQESINDLSTIRSGAAAGATAYQKPGTGIPASDMAAGVIPDVSGFITKSVNDLVNYYLKNDTYTKAEVQALIGAIQGFSYEVVSELPTASASTMGKIYLVPSSDPQTQNVKDEFITLESSGSYSWEQIGSTAIDLSGYVTTSQLNSALANYTTTADLTTLLAGKQATLTFDNAPTQNSDNPVKSGGIYTALSAKYEKPSEGIPSTDLALGVQTSLGKADSAYQKPGTGIPASDLASGVIPDISGKQDTITTVNVTVDNNTGTPSGEASVSGSTLSIAFSNLKGAKGDTGATGATGPQGPQGEQGNSGYSGAAGELEVVNNLTDGGATAALSAEMGKKLRNETPTIQQVGDDSDLLLTDDEKYILAKFKDGHFIVKKFTSESHETVSYFSPYEFRAYIPIYRDVQGKYFTTFDFGRNMISGSKAAFVSPSGSDSNSGLTPSAPKKTINAALGLSVNTVVLLEGTYVAGTHFTAGTQLAGINLIGIGNVTVDANGGEPFKVTGDFYAENIKFTNGNHGSLWVYTTDTTDIITFRECAFNDSLIDDQSISTAQSLGGLRAQGGTIFLYRCEASGNGYDGFNYHSAPDSTPATACHVAEVECFGYMNGVNSSYESNNGSTAHDGVKIVRLNCKYAISHGGVIADVHSGTVSYNFGCEASAPTDLGSSYRQYQANYFCATSAVMHLYGCKSAGAWYDISVSGSGVVNTDDAFISNYTTGGTLNIL